MASGNLHRSTAGRILAVVLLLLLLVGTVFVAGAQDVGNVLRVGINAPQELDPALGTADAEVLLNRAIYDYLVDVLPDNTIAPNLASSWDLSDDGLTYTFHLVDGVTFQDGSPMTSADVVFTFNRLVQIESSATALLGDFQVSAPDASTVVFTLPQVNPDFLYGVGSRFAGILKDGTDSPNQLVEGDNPYVNFNGTGPFKLTDYRPGETAVLVKNDHYWKMDEPALDGLTFVYIDDPAAQIDALRSGAVDVIFRVPLDQIDALSSMDGVSVFNKASNTFPLVRIRSDAGHLGEDVRIRQAFKLATDKQAINDLLLNGRGIIGNNDPIGPLYGDYYNDKGDANQVTADPAAACDLIKQTGQDRIQATLHVVDSFNYPDVATVLQQQWAEGCIDVDIQVETENVYYADTGWLEVDLGITGWGTRAVPQEYLNLMFVSDGKWNEAHWSNPELDALVAQAAATVDHDTRRDLYHQISNIIDDQGPAIIPFFQPVYGAASTAVEGLDMNPFPGLTDFRTVTVNR